MAACTTLLIVDSCPENRAKCKHLLASDDSQGFVFLEASSVGSAVDLCRSNPPDCVIVKQQLGVTDAVQFLTLLKDGAAEAPFPVVLIGNDNSERSSVWAIRTGAHSYLGGKFTGDQLRSAVRTAMARHSKHLDSPFRILIIDDSPEDRSSYRRYLLADNSQYVFAEAETGGEGLAICATFNPTCILLDFQLPDTDGVEVLTSIMHRFGDDGVAVIMLTGHGSEALAVRALKAGAEDYLVKGKALDSLPQAVRSAVEKVLLRKRIEEQRRELERSRNQLETTLSSIGDGVLATDPNGRVTFLNPVAERLTGWSTSSARGKQLDEVFVIVDEESRRPVENPALRALKSGNIVGLANHTVLIARDGTERSIDDSAAPIRDGTGEVFGAVLVFRDVTERRRADESLLLQARVLDSMNEGVSVSDQDGIIFYTNPAEDRMFGYERGELLQKHVFTQDDYSKEESRKFAEAVYSHIEREGYWEGEWRNVRKDGTKFTSYARITTVEIRGKTCFLCVQQDITFRRLLEDELQTRVNELALADRRKDQFLAMLAHELRNPLAPIKNSLHVLKLETREWKNVDHARQVMERQVGHLSRLVDDLLDVSRITQGKVKLKFEKLDLTRLLKDCVADHQNEFSERNIAVMLDISAESAWVNGDPTRLTQVVENFLTNALKFTNKGGRVTVSLHRENGYAKLSIRDDGIGIEPDVLPNIFEVFAQADKSLDRSPGGLGLGLAIVKGLVELHGGKVEAKSDGIGKGTEMSVTLSLEHDGATDLSEASVHRVFASKKRVLVIEDNHDSAESLRLLLHVSGYEVRVAFTGSDGVRQAIEWQPEAIVCDVGLPEMDGFAVARRLRADSTTSRARLIAVTGYGRDEDVANALASGFDDHLVKPADFDLLLEKIERTAA